MPSLSTQNCSPCRPCILVQGPGGKYTYEDGVLYYGVHKRASIGLIEAAAERAPWAAKTWFMSQFLLWGIVVRLGRYNSMSLDDVKEEFTKAFDEGKFNKLAPHMVQFEKVVRAQYKQFRPLQTTNEPLIWERLDADWKKGDPTPKYEESESLDGSTLHSDDEEEDSEEEYEVGEVDSPAQSTTEDDASMEETNQESSDPEPPRTSKQTSQDIWEKRMKKHTQLMRRLVDEKDKPFSLNRAVGSYIVHCNGLQTKFPAHVGKLTLDISLCPGSHGLLVDFDFGHFIGTMLMADSTLARDRICREQSELSEEQSVDSSSDHESEDDQKANEIKSALNALLRKAKDKRRRKRRAEQGLSNKPLTTRLWVNFRCYEEYPLYYSSQETVFASDGWLEFKEGNCMSFNAEFDFPMVRSQLGRSNRLMFRGYKISENPRRYANSWSSYDSSKIRARRSCWDFLYT